MISKEVFQSQMDSALKTQGLKKPERQQYIAAKWSQVQRVWRDAHTLLEHEEKKAREYAKAKAKLKKVPTENQEQKAFVSWFKAAHTNCIIFCAWNGGSRTPSEMATQKGLGVLAGVSDLCILHPSGADIWVEMKRTKGGIQSEAQIAFEGIVNNRPNNYYVLGIGAEDAKAKVTDILSKLGA